MALDKKYKRYAQDILAGFVQDTAEIGHAPAGGNPYVRYDMAFHHDRDEPLVETARVGNITIHQPASRREIDEMANPVTQALRAAYADFDSQLTIESHVSPSLSGDMLHANFFIYSDSHQTPEALHTFLKNSRKRAQSQLNDAFDEGINLNPET